MAAIKVKNIEIGSGTPKICVPFVGRDKKEIMSELAALDETPCDIVEWRADYYGDIFNVGGILEILSELSAALKKKVLLFTFRTKGEGGEKQITPSEYLLLNEKVIASANADIIDIELSAGDDIVKQLVYTANKADARILISSHDFEKTPEKEIIIKKLCIMQNLGADITKIAVMPLNVKDVATVMDAMAEMLECYADKPFVIISMGALGCISRLAGEVFGSAVTFGALTKPSAPGQLNARELRLALETIHRAMN